MLHWRFLHKGFYVANADGTADDKLGVDIYTVRTTPRLLQDSPDRPWRAESPDGLILTGFARHGKVIGLTLAEAKTRCEQDARWDGYSGPRRAEL